MKLQQVKLQHIYREGNQLADLLAEKGRLHEEEGLILVTKLSSELRQFLNQDIHPLYPPKEQDGIVSSLVLDLLLRCRFLFFISSFLGFTEIVNLLAFLV